ncbi:MAG: metallophosphoesterase [Byssovorax sp.]
MHHTVVLSDIHLSEVERTDGLWMRYRQEAYSPDRSIAEMLRELSARVGGDSLSLVLDGDVFDFDAPRVIGKESVFHDLPRTAEHAVPMIRAILDDHPIFVGALAEVLAQGHEVVMISGNHDVQLTLPEVRAVIAERLVEAALALPREGEATLTAEELRRRVVFRAWFHRTADGIVIEHGNQYDHYCSFRYPMAPFGRDPKEIQPTLGSLTARNFVSRMGYFNPHVDSSFMLSAFGYLAHWARYYLFSRRSLAFAWAVGAVRTALKLLHVREPETRARRRQNLAAAARETKVPVRLLARHARIFARPVEERLGQVLRELWLDRILLGAGLLGLAAVWFFLTEGALSAGAALAPVVLLGYELAVPKPGLDENWKAVQRAAREVAKVHKATAVVFGHTHHPEGAWERGVFIGNTGSWSAAFKDLACTQPISDEQPVVWLRSDASGRIEGGLYTWKPGRFTEQSPRPVG